MSDNKGRRAGPKMDRAIQDKIGRELRSFYEELLRQPLPEKLTAPLGALHEVQTARQRLEEAVQAMRNVAASATPGVAAPAAANAPPDRRDPDLSRKATA